LGENVSKEFNYKRAWRELARPAFAKLSKEVRDLLDFVIKDCRDCRQGPDLNVPWPDDDLKARFMAIPSRELAVAARTIYFWGHWGHTGLARVKLHGKVVQEVAGSDFDCWEPKQSATAYIKRRLADPWLRKEDFTIEYVKHGSTDCHGATWKFANYADQILNNRLGFDASRKAFPRWQSYEGMLRLHRTGGGGWTNDDVGWATSEHSDKADWIEKNWSQFVDKGDRGAVLQQELVGNDPDRAWFDTDQFMDHKPGTEYGSDELPDLYQTRVVGDLNVLRVIQFNHKVAYGRNGGTHIKRGVDNDHPFCIGVKHMQGDSMYLDPASAPCDACGMPYENHTHETGLLVQAARNISQAELPDVLGKLQELNAERDDGIDGFAFAPSKDFIIEGVTQRE
jgi:hypothetical protein